MADAVAVVLHLQPELVQVELLHKQAQVVLVMEPLAVQQFHKAHHFLLVAVVVQDKLVQLQQVI
jgi:hypothetical protein